MLHPQRLKTLCKAVAFADVLNALAEAGKLLKCSIGFGVFDTIGTTLPAPSRESGSRPRNNAPAAGARDDDLGFMDFVRRTVDTILKKLLS